MHRFVRHGDERVATLARRLLTALTYPLLLMLTRWLMHGTHVDFSLIEKLYVLTDD